MPGDGLHGGLRPLEGPLPPPVLRPGMFRGLPQLRVSDIHVFRVPRHRVSPAQGGAREDVRHLARPTVREDERVGGAQTGAVRSLRTAPAPVRGVFDHVLSEVPRAAARGPVCGPEGERRRRRRGRPGARAGRIQKRRQGHQVHRADSGRARRGREHPQQVRMEAPRRHAGRETGGHPRQVWVEAARGMCDCDVGGREDRTLLVRRLQRETARH
mmetsp:Transcript_26236/g.40613  ORF Transcript_26236/g.40613 Transcript_26236/m.40613 type:complete len:214 (-) Transcript_26236:27-668(-)